MLMCDLCDEHVPEGYIVDHMIKHHHDKIQEFADDHVYEWDGSDPRTEALTAWERNPGGV